MFYNHFKSIFTIPFLVESASGDRFPWKSGTTCKSSVSKCTGTPLSLDSKILFNSLEMAFLKISTNLKRLFLFLIELPMQVFEFFMSRVRINNVVNEPATRALTSLGQPHSWQDGAVVRSPDAIHKQTLVAQCHMARRRSANQTCRQLH